MCHRDAVPSAPSPRRAAAVATDAAARPAARATRAIRRFRRRTRLRRRTSNARGSTRKSSSFTSPRSRLFSHAPQRPRRLDALEPRDHDGPSPGP